MGTLGAVAALAAGYSITALLLHGGEATHIEAGAEGAALAGQYYHPDRFLLRKTVGCGDQRLEHGLVQRVHLVRAHQPDVGDTVRNRYRDAIFHEQISSPVFLCCGFTQRPSFGSSQSTN